MNWTLAYAVLALVPWMLWLMPRWLSRRRFGACAITACLHALALGWLSSSVFPVDDPIKHALIVIGVITLVTCGGLVQHAANNWYARHRDPLWEKP